LTLHVGGKTVNLGISQHPWGAQQKWDGRGWMVAGREKGSCYGHYLSVNVVYNTMQYYPFTFLCLSLGLYVCAFSR